MRTPKYYSAYIQANGQPRNGYAEHTSKRAARARARELRDSLPLGSGGRAYAGEIDGELLCSWWEHIEGGYWEAV